MATRNHAALLALADATPHDWHKLAALVEEAGSTERLLRREWSGFETYDVDEVERLVDRTDPEAIPRYESTLERLAEQGIRMTSVLDDDYPINLRYIHNRPPFLFIRGDLTAQDNRAVAVVGTRTPSPIGVDHTHRLATELARHHVTVLSGLARGIDTAAHQGALSAGGRTVAVMGTGISAPIYPPENRPLAEQIVEHGAPGLTVPTRCASVKVLIPTSQRCHERNGGGHRRRRSRFDQRSQDAGPLRARARQAPLPDGIARRRAGVGRQICRASGHHRRPLRRRHPGGSREPRGASEAADLRLTVRGNARGDHGSPRLHLLTRSTRRSRRL
ncbi:MAG: hypothetical protein E6J14_14340 [Chloroflexi bacterium]|nr:MAG: hypothetical protein E6J14_14340 [Chloroflexota bacterium]